MSTGRRILEYGAHDANQRGSIFRATIVFGIAAWLTGALAITGAWFWAYLTGAKGDPALGVNGVCEIALILLSIFVPLASGLLLGSLVLLRAYTKYRMLRSWRDAGVAGVIFALLLPLPAIAASFTPFSERLAFGVFLLGAGLMVFAMARWLLRCENDLVQQRAL